jgi:hypothetical protein
MKLTTSYRIWPTFESIAKRAEDLSPVMSNIKTFMVAPRAARAWLTSGLQSQSGELRDAITTWSGKVSAGVTLRTKKGRDLVLPKGQVHTYGKKKQAKVKKKQVRVRAHSRAGVNIGEHMRTNPGSPWGDIPARPFFVTGKDFGQGESGKIREMIGKFIKNATT